MDILKEKREIIASRTGTIICGRIHAIHVLNRDEIGKAQKMNF